MCDDIGHFGQGEYTRVLNFHLARARHLTQGECELILMEHGASYQQAKNGAYVYLVTIVEAVAQPTRGPCRKSMTAYWTNSERPKGAMENVRGISRALTSHMDKRRQQCTSIVRDAA